MRSWNAVRMRSQPSNTGYFNLRFAAVESNLFLQVSVSAGKIRSHE